MLKRLRAWLAESRRYHQDNVRTWEAPSTPNADGLSPFQRETERRIIEILRSHGMMPLEHEVLGEDEAYIRLKLASPEARVFIYLDGAEILGPEVDFRLERWDARTPEEHYEQFSARLEELIEQAS